MRIEEFGFAGIERGLRGVEFGLEVCVCSHLEIEFVVTNGDCFESLFEFRVSVIILGGHLIERVTCLIELIDGVVFLSGHLIERVTCLIELIDGVVFLSGHLIERV